MDKANQKGTTALMRATQEGNEEVVGILVSAGADVSKRNNERMNALMLGSQVRGHFALTTKGAWLYVPSWVVGGRAMSLLLPSGPRWSV